jgi:tetracycline repressor-like protein
MGNAEATKERILEAALAEFSAHGIAGARVDRIAEAAECNKHLMRVHEEYPFTPNDLPGYAAKVFDFAMTNPDLMRLLAWSTLEKNEGSAECVAALDMKVAALTEAQKAGQAGMAFPPEFLLVAVMSLATAWSATSPFGPSISRKAAECSAAVRKNLFEAVRLLAGSDKARQTHDKCKPQLGLRPPAASPSAAHPIPQRPVANQCRPTPERDK